MPETYEMHRLAGQDTEILRAGAGAPIVLLHGSADSPAAFRDVVPLIAPSRTVWAPGLPPIDVDPREREVFALDIDLPWLDALMDTSGARSLVAHSYGALLALRWALAHPGRLDRLVLGEPIAWGVAQGDVPTTERLAVLRRTCFDPFRVGETAVAIAALVDYWNGAGFWAALPGRIRAGLVATAPRTCAEVASGWSDRTSAAELASLVVPTTMLCGAHTTAESMVVSRLIAAALPDASLIVLQGAGHQFLRSHPAEVAAAALR